MKSRPLVPASCAIAISLLLVGSNFGYSDDKPPSVEELSAWVMTYYQHPDPEHFIEKVRQMSSAGMLHNSNPQARPDQNVMFLGKVLAANRSKLKDWLNALGSLTAEERAVLKRAAWYSGTDEGNAWLKEQGESALADGPRPMLLDKQWAMQLEPFHLDELWEWFFATGEEEPVGKIVSLFSLAHEAPQKDSLELLPPPVKPAGDVAAKPDSSTPNSAPKLSEDRLYQLRMHNYRILRPALWSCTSLAIQQDRVLEILKTLESKHPHQGIKAWLGQIVKIAETERQKRATK